MQFILSSIWLKRRVWKTQESIFLLYECWVKNPSHRIFVRIGDATQRNTSDILFRIQRVTLAINQLALEHLQVLSCHTLESKVHREIIHGIGQRCLKKKKKIKLHEYKGQWLKYRSQKLSMKDKIIDKTNQSNTRNSMKCMEAILFLVKFFDRTKSDWSQNEIKQNQINEAFLSFSFESKIYFSSLSNKIFLDDQKMGLTRDQKYFSC